jgi:uncharacterized membrane protein
MYEPRNLPPIRPVRANDVVPERPWQSSKRLLINLGILIVVWAIISLAINVLHVPVEPVTVGVVITVVAIAFDVVPWRRKRRS